MSDKKNNTQPRRKPGRKGRRRRKGGRKKKERERNKRSDSERKTQRRGHHHVTRKRGREEKSKRVSDKNNYRPSLSHNLRDETMSSRTNNEQMKTIRRKTNATKKGKEERTERGPELGWSTLGRKLTPSPETEKKTKNQARKGPPTFTHTSPEEIDRKA